MRLGLLNTIHFIFFVFIELFYIRLKTRFWYFIQNRVFASNVLNFFRNFYWFNVSELSVSRQKFWYPSIYTFYYFDKISDLFYTKKLKSEFELERWGKKSQIFFKCIKQTCKTREKWNFAFLSNKCPIVSPLDRCNRFLFLKLNKFSWFGLVWLV